MPDKADKIGGHGHNLHPSIFTDFCDVGICTKIMQTYPETDQAICKNLSHATRIGEDAARLRELVIGVTLGDLSVDLFFDDLPSFLGLIPAVSRKAVELQTSATLTAHSKRTWEPSLATTLRVVAAKSFCLGFPRNALVKYLAPSFSLATEKQDAAL